MQSQEDPQQFKKAIKNKSISKDLNNRKKQEVLAIILTRILFKFLLDLPGQIVKSYNINIDQQEQEIVIPTNRIFAFVKFVIAKI